MYIKINLICTLIVASMAYEDGKNESESSRKHYGLSFNNGCGDYPIVFKCMSTCKSLSYKIYRVDFQCRCSCHDMKTTSVVPHFRWKTNGTRRRHPKTFSPGQYSVIGSLSPSPELPTNATVDECKKRIAELMNSTASVPNATEKDNTTAAIKFLHGRHQDIDDHIDHESVESETEAMKAEAAPAAEPDAPPKPSAPSEARKPPAPPVNDNPDNNRG